MQWIETSGRDVQEAVESALFQLGISRAELEYTVITEPRRGILGFMKGEASIRARVKPTTYKAKESPARRARGDRKGAKKSPTGTKAASRPKAPPKEEKATKPVQRASRGAADPTSAETPAKKQTRKASIPIEESDQPARPAREPRPAKKAGGSRRATMAREPEEPSPKRPSTGRAGTETSTEKGSREMTSDDQPNGDVVATVSLDEQAESAREFLEGLLDEFDMDADVVIQRPEESTAVVSVEGDGLGLLIGPKASTLGAIQELTRTAVQRHAGASNGRLLVDVGGYRAKRKVALEGFAVRIANEVIEAQAEKSLEPMNAADRKVIHDAINEIDGVGTRSDGEEPHRRVVVFPEA